MSRRFRDEGPDGLADDDVWAGAAFADVRASRSRARQCWCGRATTARPRGCIFHGDTDLCARVRIVMVEMRVTDRVTDRDVGDARVWLATVALWKGLATDNHGAGQLGDDVRVDFCPMVPNAIGRLDADEIAALTGEAIMGRWPW